MSVKTCSQTFLLVSRSRIRNLEYTKIETMKCVSSAKI